MPKKKKVSCFNALLHLFSFPKRLWPLLLLPRTISSVMQTTVCLRRLEEFFKSEELEENENLDYEPISENKAVLSIKEASFSWDEDSPTPTLSDIDIQVVIAHFKCYECSLELWF